MRNAEASSDRRPLDWTELFGEHGGWLRRVVRARLGEPEAVEEVLQEVSLAAIRHQDSLADRDKVAAWLYQIAVRQAVLYRRRQGRRRKHASAYATERQAETGRTEPLDLLGWLLDRERRTLVRRALEKLSPEDAQILLLKYEEDWNYERIGKHLTLTHHGVANRLRRARQRLRDELARLQIRP